MPARNRVRESNSSSSSTHRLDGGQTDRSRPVNRAIFRKILQKKKKKRKRKIINRRIKKGERQKRERGGKKEKQAGKLDKRAFPRN